MLASALASGESLRLEDAIIRALERNPELATFAYELNAQQGRVQQAGARSPLELGLLVENALGTGARSSFDAAETTLSIGFVLEHGAVARRRAAAEAGGILLNTEINIRRVDLAAEVTRRFINVLANQQHVRELRRARVLVEQTLAAVQARVRAARVPEAEEARAEAQLARAKLDEEHAEHELLTARRQLAALWGETEATFTEASGTLSTLPALIPFETLRSELAKNPDFERFVSEQRLRESELRLAESRRRPAWQVTAGVRRFEDRDDHAFIVGLTVPFASRDYSQGAITQARAQLEEVGARQTALRVRLDTELFAMYQELFHSYTEVRMLRDDVLPKMERAMKESQYAYERGRYGYVELVAAQRELLELRRGLSEAYADVHRYRIEIERLTGASLTSKTLP
jgi:cobalt-zinc-cadmium efflux system outer membrane protein